MDSTNRKEFKIPVKINKSTEAPAPDRPLAQKPAKKRPGWLKTLAVLAVFTLTALAVFANYAGKSEDNEGSWFYSLPLVRQIKNLAESASQRLKGEERDRVNILLLGMGGKTHEGGYLTDTIMLASLEPSTKKASLISIPRDLAIPVEGKGWQKINSINAYAELEEEGTGGAAVSQAVGDLLGQPVDYFVRVDFQGFINIVDEMEGLDVTVENELKDYRYPVMGKEDDPDYEARYEYLHVLPGPQHMDGSLALKFARSRHALGGEGSDFARARRQQLILSAAKDKALSAGTLLRPGRIANIIQELDAHVSTNLKIWEMLRLWDLFKDIGKDDIVTRVIDNGPGGLLVDSTSSQGAYILSPKSGDFSEIQYLVNNIFAEAPAEAKSAVASEQPALEVRNGTWINGLASQVALDLEKIGFSVVRIGNSSRQNFEKSVIYDLSIGAKPNSLRILQNTTKANISTALPDWLVEEIGQELKGSSVPVQPDFILIIGTDMDQSGSGKENGENGTSEN
jgi:LCP family protein required for cell wall assembly